MNDVAARRSGTTPDFTAAALATALHSAMIKRLTLAASLAAVLLCSAGAQVSTLDLPAPATEADAMPVDDTPQGGRDTLQVTAAEETALRQADLLPADQWEIAELAAALGTDQLAAFAFVKESIAVDPYVGVLRGAAGTLAARAGSSWDRALLLAALLKANGHSTRLAYEPTESGSSAHVAPAGSLSVASPLQTLPRAASVVDTERLRGRAGRDYALVRQALEDAEIVGVDGPASSADSPDPASDHGGAHAWVQVLQPDGTWLDLDPSQNDPGTTAVSAAEGSSTAATTTADALPGEFQHGVTLSVVAESLEGGEATEAVVLEQRLTAAAAASQEIWLYFQPDAAGIGGAIADLFEGKSYVPVLMVDGETQPGTAFSLSAGDDDSFFGGFLGGGGPELISLRLDLTASGPGFGPVSATRTLFDRVAPSDREAGVIMSELLEPLPGTGVPTAFSALHHVMVSTGGANPRQHAVARAFAANFAANDLLTGSAGDFPLADLLLPLAVADQAVVVASERTIVDGLRSEAVRAFIAHPRVFLSTLEPLPGEDGATAMTLDLALDGVSYVTGDPVPDVFAWQVWYGALQSALETELTLARSRAVDPATSGVASVSLAIDEALANGQRLSVINPAEAETVATSAAALRTALRNGALAVVVGDAARGGGFWAIDPTSGATRSVMEPGVRVGFTWGRNYTNASSGGVRWVVDPRTANTIGYEKDGKFYRYNRKPPSRCSGGTEYVMLLGCVSIPASMTLGMTYGVIVTAIVSWAIAVLELAFLL